MVTNLSTKYLVEKLNCNGEMPLVLCVMLSEDDIDDLVTKMEQINISFYFFLH